MAAKDVYVPCFMVGEDGRKSYEFIKLKGTVIQGPGTTVPEGECMIDSRVIRSTPPSRLQPRGNREDAGDAGEEETPPPPGG